MLLPAFVSLLSFHSSHPGMVFDLDFVFNILCDHIVLTMGCKLLDKCLVRCLPIFLLLSFRHYLYTLLPNMIYMGMFIFYVGLLLKILFFKNCF